MKASMLSVVEASVAATGPTGVAFQIHQMVIAFHSTKVSAAHPKVDHQPRREASARSLIHSRGTNAASSGSPDRPSHPAESRMAERMAAASFRDMEVGMGILRAQK